MQANQRRLAALAIVTVLMSAAFLAACSTEVEPVGICRLAASGQIVPDLTKDACTAREGNWADELMPTAYAEPPVGAKVDSIPLAAWNNATCNNDTTPIEVPVDTTSWIEWRIMWGAVDSATARANWDSISYQLLYDDTVPAEVSNSLAWRSDSLSVKCPDKTITGVLSSRVVYLRPFTAGRRVRGTYNFLGSTNDGFSTYARGTSLSIVANFKPRS
ncbi:MAG: hypothetical protein FIB01_12805 [Gemmatimonadetes bacterium]|nr:hypothetical protein [Gemmatimonadota bacterium]